MSFPLLPVTSSKVRYHFPMAQSNAFVFRNGYRAVDTLPTTVGFWLKFQIAQRIGLEGLPFQSDTIDVVTGWNMIGTISSALSPNTIIQMPPNIVNSPYFEYTNGYRQADSLRPSKGYWVKVSGDGQLILSSTLSAANQLMEKSFEPIAEIFIEDAEQGQQTLYLIDAKDFSTWKNSLELPPPPPIGAFDARFQSQRFAEILSVKNEAQRYTVNIQSSSYPVKLLWKPCRLEGVVEFIHEQTGKLLSRTSMKRNASVMISDPALSKIVIKVTPLHTIPTRYALYQNYPNPFNSSTTISFDLPEPSFVTLKVYNMLGQEVTTLISEKEYAAGTQTIRWNASDVSSGIYFYRLLVKDAQSGVQRFQQVNKLLLLK
jgi:hypothetical protein